MQPTAKPRLNCLEHLGQRILGLALRWWIGMVGLPNVDGGQGFSFGTPRRKSSCGKLPVGRGSG
jgi:hypothetical protein